MKKPNKNMKKVNEMSIVERVQSPTPDFFKKVRNIGIVVGGIGALIMASPFAIPVGLVSIAGYLTTAGSIMAGISMTAVDTEKLNKK